MQGYAGAGPPRRSRLSGTWSTGSLLPEERFAAACLVVPGALALAAGARFLGPIGLAAGAYALILSVVAAALFVGTLCRR